MIASLLLNQLIEVKTGIFTGNTGVATAIMADGRTLEVELDSGSIVLVDASFVREVRAGGLLMAKPRRTRESIKNTGKRMLGRLK